MHNSEGFKNLLPLTAARTVVVTILTGALALAMPQQLPAQQQSPASSAPVTVVNTSANPVPMTGTVSVGGTPTVNAQQAGTWSVGIAGNSVTTPLLVRDVENLRRQRFFKNVFMEMNAGSFAKEQAVDVPVGKRLVIEFVSMRADFESQGQTMQECSVSALQEAKATGVGADGFDATQFYVPVLTGNTQGGGAVYIASSGLTHLEAIGGTGTVLVHVLRSNFDGHVNVRVSITGYLVDAQ